MYWLSSKRRGHPKRSHALSVEHLVGQQRSRNNATQSNTTSKIQDLGVVVGRRF